MRRDLDFKDLIRFQEDQTRCPVETDGVRCNNPLPYNIGNGKFGQWAHYLCNDKVNIRAYGKKIIDSKYNGIRVCSLKCNNAVQIKRANRPLLADKMAIYIAEREGEDLD